MWAWPSSENLCIFYFVMLIILPVHYGNSPSVRLGVSLAAIGKGQTVSMVQKFRIYIISISCQSVRSILQVTQRSARFALIGDHTYGK